MFNRVIKISFAIIGAVTGFTLIKTFYAIRQTDAVSDINIIVYILATLSTAVIFYSTGNRFIDWLLKAIENAEAFIQNMTLYELMISVIGLISGLIVANLISIPIIKIDVIGVPLAIIVNILCGCAGINIAIGKKSEKLFESFKGEMAAQKNANLYAMPKILDTSVIIDGRIVDIVRSGFLEGELVVPSFVLEELRYIADSPDVLKRNRGRRGLDVLNAIQKELAYPVRIENVDIHGSAEVDDELLKLAKRLKGEVLTIDYNLNKVASLQGVSVLNVNELANAVKPIALPGEEMVVHVIKDGKENGQGIGYLDDGTMIVVDGGRKHMGENVTVTVTSVLQTAAGRMIFAKPKYSIERI